MRIDPSIARAVAFVNAYVGRPYAEGGLGPHVFSCWGLARTCQREVFGRDLPIINVNEKDHRAMAELVRNSDLREIWHPHAMPAHGDLVTLARHTDPRHVGVYLNIDRGGILHAVRDAGVRFDALSDMRQLGWYQLRFHRPVEVA